MQIAPITIAHKLIVGRFAVVRSLVLCSLLAGLLAPLGAVSAGAASVVTERDQVASTGVARQGDTAFLFARRDDGGVWVRKTDGLWYSGWSPLGGQTDLPPAAASTGRLLLVAMRGPGKSLWVNHTLDGNSFAGWRAVGGSLAAAPSIAAIGDRLHLFWRDDAGTVWQQVTSDGENFSTPVSLGGPIDGAPVALLRDGVLTLVAQGRDGRLYTLAARDGTRAAEWGIWQQRDVIPAPAPAGQLPPLTLDVGVNFISAHNWTSYQLPAYARLRPMLAKFSFFYDQFPAVPVFGERHLDDAIAAGARTMIIRTAETRIAPDEVERQLTAPLPDTGRSLLDYIRDRRAAGSPVEFWIEVGNEPDVARVSPRVARYALLATIRDVGRKYRATDPNLHWLASMPTSDGIAGSVLPEYRGLAYLDLLLSDQGDGLGAITDHYDALGVHLYGADTFQQSFPHWFDPSTPPDCAGSNGDASCPTVILDRLLSRTDRPIFVTEAGLNSALPWVDKAQFYVTALQHLPVQVRGFALFTLSLDPEWYAGTGERCPLIEPATCARYALDVDERGRVDSSFAGANGIGQCYRLPPGARTSAACWPPCAAAQRDPPRPRSNVQRVPCEITAWAAPPAGRVPLPVPPQPVARWCAASGRRPYSRVARRHTRRK